MSDLFAARRRTVRRRGWRWALILLGLLVVGSGGVWLVAFSSVLALQRVEVIGLTTLKTDEVVAAAAAETGRPLARVDLGVVERRVKAMPRVETVEVSRSWPHTLSIQVRERVAIAWIERGGQYRGVDRHGTEFRSYPRKPDLIELRVSAFDTRKRHDALLSLGTVVVAVRAHYPQLLPQVAYVSADSRDSVTFHLRDGRTVVWGSAAKATRKADTLRVLMQGVAARHYDVSAPEQPTTRN